MKKAYFFSVGVLIVLFCLQASGGKREAQVGPTRPPVIGPSSSSRVDADFGKIPLQFIPNRGQMDGKVAYYVQGGDKTIYFAADGLTFVLSGPPGPGIAGAEGKGLSGTEAGVWGGKPGVRNPPGRDPSNRWVVKLDFLDSNADAIPVGLESSGAVISFFKGKPEEWKTGLSACSKIVYRELWPGIDLLYYGTFNRMKYEFIVQPGADPSRIKLAYRGAKKVGLTAEGRLEVKTPAGGFEDDNPIAYQEVDGERKSVSVKYVLGKVAESSLQTVVADPAAAPKAETAGLTHAYGFELGEYDRSRPLVLDPAVLVYCGYIGGSGGERGGWITVDGSGSAYIVGDTSSSEATFPVTVGPDLTFNGTYDAFVAKVNASGTALVYCGYIGGAGTTLPGPGIAIDGLGNAYIMGFTECTQTTFPVTVGPDLTYNGGAFDAFVAKINASGTALDYCGYIGGEASDRVYGIAVDGSGHAFMAGYTGSTELTFPVNSGPDLTFNGGNSDAFVAKVNASGTALDFCGYIGGSGFDDSQQIAVDGTGHAFITGETTSTEATFPVSIGPDLSFNGGTQDAFVAKVNPSGTALDYCGYIGGDNFDRAFGIALDNAGHAHIVGYTASSEATFPVSVGPDLSYNGGAYDGFVAKVNPSGTALDNCGYIGGSGEDRGYGIAVDGTGKVFVAGFTASSEATFPVKVGPDLSYNGGTYDAFVAGVNPSSTALIFCGYIGGSSYEYGYGPALDRLGNLYITGVTNSSEVTFPVIVGPDVTLSGTGDAYVAKIRLIQKDELVGTWDGQGVYYRNSDTGTWTKLATAADLIACGDLYGDDVDDLIGIWSGQAGVWVKNSANGNWAYLGSSPRHIAAGDMNGDGRMDLLGTWDGQGVYYRDSITGTWNQMATPATLITTGDLDGDAKSDLVGIWPSQAGVWVQYSNTGSWDYLGSSPQDFTTGDMNGDGRADLVGTWGGQGVFFRNSMTGSWVMMATPADQVTAGDLDGDGTDDLIGIWAGQAGVWVKYSATVSWAYIGSSARDIATGKMSGDLGGSGLHMRIPLNSPMGGFADGPSRHMNFEDLSSEGPGGNRFWFKRGANLAPRPGKSARTHVPGPGESGFRYSLQKNLWPQGDGKK